MIGFFRGVRKKLANENQFIKYIRYAIGEILLVVIGILIALQVNNWNNQRLASNEELEILIALKDGLTSDHADLIYNTNRIRSSLKAAEYTFQAINGNKSYTDTIALLMGKLMFPVRFLYSTSAFETLKSKGIGLIRNDALRNKIVATYDAQYTFFLDEETNHIEELNRGLKYIFPTRFEESYVFDLEKDDYAPKLVPLNFEALKKDHEFIYYIKSYNNRNKIMLDFHYAKIINSVESLIKDLEIEIEKLN